MPITPNDKDKIIKRNRVKDATIEGIDVTEEKAQPNFFEDTCKKKVGIYARVSTDSSQQTLSYEMQQKYYSEMVEHRPNWTLIKIYADEAVTGTNTKHRDEFNAMISDCIEGKIDLIVTKSVSRFSRNILDAISHVRMLAAQKPPVGVYFENEGIYTLSQEGETRLSYTVANAQEESRAKSMAMESSIKMRFSHGMFLTPPLLGYDNDEYGKLIINEDEAVTVRLIFFMYLLGRSTGEIAKRLTELGRKSKKGNTQWSSGSVYSQLVNERHCGAVKARKTWTPSFLDHLAKKNRTHEDGTTDRKQYTKHNHHEAIISPDDFATVQKMIANAKYGNRNFLPQLQVVSGGALHGFVSINPHWAAFSAEDYIAASISAGDDVRTKNTQAQVMAKQGDIDLRGMELICGRYFADAYVPSATFNDDALRFSSSCVRKFDGEEYVELLIHPVRKLLVVRPCKKEHKNAIRWMSYSSGKFFGRDIGCAAYIGVLYGLLNWEPATKYKLRCVLHKVSGETVAIFDARNAQPHNCYTFMSRPLLPGTKRKGKVEIYNTMPHLNPTPESSLYESIEQIVKRMRNNGDGG